MAPLQDTLIQPVQERLHLGEFSKFLRSMNELRENVEKINKEKLVKVNDGN